MIVRSDRHSLKIVRHRKLVHEVTRSLNLKTSIAMSTSSVVVSDTTTLIDQSRSSVEKSVRVFCAKLNMWNDDKVLISAIEQWDLTRACCCKSVNRFENEKSKSMQKTVLILACKSSSQISSVLNWTMTYKSTVFYLSLFLQSTILFLSKHRLKFRNLVFELRLIRLVAESDLATSYDLRILTVVRANSVHERNFVLKLSLETFSALL